MKKYPEDTYILIEDYLNKKLSPEKMANIRQRIEEDADFAKEVEWTKSFVIAMSDKRGVETFDVVEKIHANRSPEKVIEVKKENEPIKTKSSNLQKVVLIALLLAPCIWFFNSWNNTTPNVITEPTQESKVESPVIGTSKEEIKEIQTEHPKPIAEKPAPPKKAPIAETSKPSIKKEKPVSNPTPQTESPPLIAQQTAPTINLDQFVTYKTGQQDLGEAEDSLLNKGLILLDMGEKHKALIVLEKYLTSLEVGEDDFEVQLITGKIYLEHLKKYDQAIAIFQKIKTSDALQPYIREAGYYLAICYVAKGDLTTGRSALQAIIDTDGHRWKEKSMQLLSGL